MLQSLGWEDCGESKRTTRLSESRGLFSPRVDYDEWTPLGRGDPLKNDPTYDYVPPVLDRVHYWIDPSSRTPDPPLVTEVPSVATPSDVPVLQTRQQPDIEIEEPSVTAADSRRDTFDPFLKFVDGPKFNSPPQQTIYAHHHHHHYLHSPSRPTQGGSVQRKPYVPHSTAYYPAPFYQHNKSPQVIPSVETHSYVLQQQPVETASFPPDVQHQRPPYTMLVPPPLHMTDTYSAADYQDSDIMTMEQTTIPPQSIPYYTTTPSPSSVTLQEADLIFQSSTQPDWDDGKTQLATIAEASSQVTWKVPTSPSPAGVKNNTYIPSSTPQITSTDNSHQYYSHNKDKFKNNLSASLIHSLLQGEASQSPSSAPTMATTTTASPQSVTTMTTGVSLTTDPLFSHYKQPAEPLRGPMYLIIQGHSKVKTYGANKHQNSFHGIPIQDNNELQGNNERSRRDASDQDEDENWVLLGKKRMHTNEVLEMSNSSKVETIPASNSTEDSAKSSDEELKSRRKRQLSLEDLIPIDEDTADELVYDFLAAQGQGSGVGAFVAQTIIDARKINDVFEDENSIG
ncbi:mucin-3A [Anabrus simplex]|uniref:mucin-3A n=1 Tax=Anabrus simplex TaxID=316456 RepID=UPI0035A35054